MKERKRTNEAQGKRGFTLLLAALVSSIVLALGLSIFTIAQKELILSSLGRDSQYAFYAADTAAECGLYWDLRHQAFATSAPSSFEIECDGESVTVTHVSSIPVTFGFEYEPNEYCAQVTVTKSDTHPRTVIHADGYSVRCELVTTSTRVLQRSVEIRY